MSLEFESLIKALIDHNINGIIAAASKIYDINHRLCDSDDWKEYLHQSKSDLQSVAVGLKDAGMPELADRLRSVLHHQMDIDLWK